MRAARAVPSFCRFRSRRTPRAGGRLRTDLTSVLQTAQSNGMSRGRTSLVHLSRTGAEQHSCQVEKVVVVLLVKDIAEIGGQNFTEFAAIPPSEDGFGRFRVGAQIG